jgi:hypothetical protein
VVVVVGGKGGGGQCGRQKAFDGEGRGGSGKDRNSTEFSQMESGLLFFGNILTG